MKQTIRIVILLVFMLSGLSVLQAQEDLTFTVPVLVKGDVIETELNNDMTTQLWAFLATEGDTVTITMTQDDSSDLDPFIVLLGSSGEVLAVDDDGGEVALSSQIEYTITTTDTYYLLASSYVFIDGVLMEDGTDYGVMPFTLTIAGNNAPTDAKTDDTPLVIYHGSLEDGVATIGESTLELPVYYYLVYATTGESITLTMDTDEFWPILHVFDPDGVRVAMDINMEEFTPAVATFVAPVDGVYIVFATDVFFYEAVEYTTTAEDDLNFTGGEFELTLTRGAVKK